MLKNLPATMLLLTLAPTAAASATVAHPLRVAEGPPVQHISVDSAGRHIAHAGYPPRSAQIPSSPAQAVCPLPAPSLLTPAQGETSSDLEYPRFAWAVVPGTQRFLFQISATNAFTRPIATDEARQFPASDETTVFHHASLVLQPLRTYFWRVASICNDGSIGVFAEARSFNTGVRSTTPCELPPPALLAPANGSLLSTLTPSTTIGTLPAVTEYNVEGSLNPGFAVIERAISVRWIGTRPDKNPRLIYPATDNLQPNTMYYWRARSVCAATDQLGPVSETFTFTTGGAAELPPSPGLIAPEDGATTGSIRVVFTFSPVPTATTYHLRVGNMTRFLTETTTSMFLNPSTQFNLAVRAANATGLGPWSATRVFTTPVDVYSTDITPAGGGVVSPSGAISVVFPPGAVSSNTTVNYRLLSLPNRNINGFAFANRAFELTASAGGQTVTTFAKPYTLTVGYSDVDLAAAGITDTAKLNLYFWDPSSARWQAVLPCAGCAVNTGTKTLTAVLDHFTEFMLAVQTGDPSPAWRVYLPNVAK
jgi:hypothetical protein